ncbi:MAG: cell division protein ZapE [Pontibacterium sp.]
MNSGKQSLADLYQSYINNGYNTDPVQQKTVEQLQRLQTTLLTKSNHVTSQGLYLWGPVGRGKTFLMDLFFSSLPESLALRLHFHRFMAMIHQQLQHYAGHKDPLQRIASDLATRYRVLCFDEFLVSEIGDAMLLGRLIRHLFDMGVSLVCTSNRPPEELYQGDIHRDRFEPTIKLLKAGMYVIPMHGDTDHRLRQLTYKGAFFVGDTAPLHSLFEAHALSLHTTDAPLMVCNRPVPCIAASDKVAWFEFSALCDGPRSQLDYIDIAKRFHSLFLSNVPLLGGKQYERIKARGTEDSARGSKETGERRVMMGRSDDPARRFIALVDELYDRRVNLFLNAAAPLDELYQGNLLSFEFNRTQSRLTEMASEEYQQTAHQP